MITKRSFAFWFETKIQNSLAYFFLVADYLLSEPSPNPPQWNIPIESSRDIIVPDRNAGIYQEALEMTYLNDSEIVLLLGAKYFEPLLAYAEQETNAWPPIKRHTATLKTMLDNLDGIAEYLVRSGTDEAQGLTPAQTAALLRRAFQARRVELLTNPGAKSFVSHFLEKKYTMFLAPRERLTGTNED